MDWQTIYHANANQKYTINMFFDVRAVHIPHWENPKFATDTI